MLLTVFMNVPPGYYEIAYDGFTENEILLTEGDILGLDKLKTTDLQGTD